MSVTINSGRIRQIEKLARRFRTAIETCDKAHLPVSFESFPQGSCGDTTLLLAKYLEQHGFKPFDYMSGNRDGCSHAWLQQHDLIVDITADQFADMEHSVFVQQGSSWHATFCGEAKHLADYERYDEDTRHMLHNAYTVILQALSV